MGGFGPTSALGNSLVTQQGTATAATSNNLGMAANALGNLGAQYTTNAATITQTIYTTQYYFTNVAMEQPAVRIRPGGLLPYEPGEPPRPIPPPCGGFAPSDAEARAKARELLFEFLSPEERAVYESVGYFVVRGSMGGRYEIHRERDGRTNPLGSPVYRLRDHGIGPPRMAAYCIHTYGIPRDDEALGFKLLIETNEGEFLETANETRLG